MGFPGQPPVDEPDRDGVAPPSSETIDARISLEKELLNAASKAAKGILTAQDPREAKEWAQTALALSQSIVILDPDLVAPDGVPIDAIHPPAPRSGAARIQTDKSRSAQSG
jgi:hypothetical protein